MKEVVLFFASNNILLSFIDSLPAFSGLAIDTEKKSLSGSFTKEEIERACLGYKAKI